MAVPILPSTAMPNAPPNSELVSESAPAEPARSGGTALKIKSVINVNNGASPTEKRIELATIEIKPNRSACARITKPIAAKISPVAMIDVGLKYVVSFGVYIDPTIKPTDHGNVHSPA